MTISMENLINCSSDLDVQLTILFIFAIFFYFFMPYASKNWVKPYIMRQSWRDQWITIQLKSLKTQFGIDFQDRQDGLMFLCLTVPILLQHLLGGSLCIPALVLGPSKFTNTLACFGALFEAGYEMQDILTRLYWKITGTNEGYNPNALMALMIIHHVMGLSLVIPMNMFYRGEPCYHEFVFLLQAAAFISFFCTYYGYTLNTKERSGLFTMKICASITWVTILYSRVVRYVWVGYLFLSIVHADGNITLFYTGSTALSLMAIMNALFFMDATTKLIKFLPMKITDENVDHVAAVSMRSSHPRLSLSVPFMLAKPKKNWSKVRGGVMMGVIKESKTE